jgi:mRNA interferase MazF
MQRGDIRVIELEPARPGEAGRSRPCVIVSNDGANLRATQLGRGVVTAVPLTTNLAHVFAFQVLLPASRTGLSRDSKAQAEQVRSMSVERVGRRLGGVPIDLMLDLDDALRTHLAL